ncbi:serine hydrolase [Acidicapsa ligni]|uniref:serine hydrolase n=1 Tax=Acidicapsa ligni TaxID=542300 RepID=UPI0021E00771|nr:serine hydrolase [Acidicapsa ligni]
MLKLLAALLLLPCTAVFALQAPTPSPLPALPKPKLQAAPSSQASPAQPVPTVPATAHTLDSADLEAFFDGILPLQLERSDIAGASVLVMKDGQVLLQKGYGYADIKKQTPVDPASTVFRLASISKLSTWISIMQLQEQGKLDLDTDVNRYLDFQIRPAFGKPVTLRNLMTHTAGFEEVSNLVVTTNQKYKISLRDYLIQNQPNRIFPPGTIPGYSNYGVGLASYIVQRVSGEPFEEYTRRHIYLPLRMMHSTFYQPAPKGFAVSEGYFADTQKPPQGFEVFNPVGAGGFSSTAPDMGRLGQALLNGGELDGTRILKPETVAAMWTPQFRTSKDMPAACMGFYQTWRNNLRWIGHGGDLTAFHSFFAVEPTQKLVLFVSFNSVGSRGHARPEIIRMFSDRYFPATLKQNFLTLSRKELEAVEGAYQPTRRADSTKLRIAALISQSSVTINKDGELVEDDVKDLRGHDVKFKPIGKDLWQAVGDQQRIFAIRDEHGKVVRLANEFAGEQDQRVSWFENGDLIFPLLGGSFAILIAVVLATIIRLGHRIFLRKRPRPAPQPGTAWLSTGAKLAAWFWVFLFLSILSFFASQGDDIMPPSPGWTPYFFALNCVIGLLLFLSFLAVISGIAVWSRDLRWITKLKFTLVALACVFLSWFSIHWHLISQIHRI